MKKIATITFHWATNYGAVLQSYALQKVVGDLGYDTEIINYVPLRVNMLQKISKILSRDFAFFAKEREIKKFRKRELKVSKKRFHTNRMLFKSVNNYSAFVAGSDQIWNPSFTATAEGKPTLSYFLNFTRDVKRISYAASFGATELDDDIKHLIKPELDKFSAISVREKTGQIILNTMGIDAAVVLDPTLLLQKIDYEKLCDKSKSIEQNKVFCYALPNGKSEIDSINEFVCKRFNETVCQVNSMGIYEWLNGIRNSKFVVTNSFHGTVFAILFHKPFISVQIKGSGMNDRLFTLLSELGLEERFCEDLSGCQIQIDREIDWESVDMKIQKLRRYSLDFLSGVLLNEN